MSRFDRYMLSQLMVVFGFFSLVMVLVYWVNRAVLLFDQLISDGQTAAVFLQFTLLSLPNVIRMVLPMSAFAAAVYVTNRLTSESELTVMQATGFSPFRMARPVLIFGAIVALMVGALAHGIVPAAMTALAEREVEISADATARLLRDGQFRHPSDGVTFYVREITPEGEMRDALLVDSTSPTRTTTFTAKRGYLAQAEGEPFLQMFDGTIQTLDHDDRSLSFTRFEETSYALSGRIDVGAADGPRLDELSTLQLLDPTPALVAAVDRPVARFLAEGHERFGEASLALVAPILGFAVLLLGGFSRFGIWRQILGAVLVVVVVKMVDTALVDAARADVRFWPLVYGGSAFGAGAAVAVLWLAGRPRRPIVHRRREAWT